MCIHFRYKPPTCERTKWFRMHMKYGHTILVLYDVRIYICRGEIHVESMHFFFQKWKFVGEYWLEQAASISIKLLHTQCSTIIFIILINGVYVSGLHPTERQSQPGKKIIYSFMIFLFSHCKLNERKIARYENLFRTVSNVINFQLEYNFYS